MRITLLLSAVLVTACADAPTQEPTQVQGQVTVDESSATRIAGSYVAGEDTLVFEARELETNLVAVTLNFHGMTLDATLDTRDGNRMWTQDAFATDSGADTTTAAEAVE